MPFAAAMPTEDEEKKKQEGQAGGVNVSGTSTSFSTGVPGQESSKPQKGSGDKFANIQSYLDANKDQGDQMGQNIQSGIESEAQTAKAGIEGLNAAAPKVEAYDPSEAYNNVTTLSSQDKQKYNEAKAGYKGPQTVDQVQGFQDTQKNVSTAASKVQNAGTEQGQRQLLKDTYQRPSYSAGENALDQTIVQNSPNSRKGFENLTQKYSGLSGMFDQASQSLGNQLNQNTTRGLQNQQAIASGEKKAMSDLMNPIQQRAEQFNRDNPMTIDRVMGDAQDAYLSQETLDMLGLNEGAEVYGRNLQDYMTPDYTQRGINDVANADERTRYAALTDLIDGKSGDLISGSSERKGAVSFDKNRFDSETSSAKERFEKEYETANINKYIPSIKSATVPYSPKKIEEDLARLEQTDRDLQMMWDQGRATMGTPTGNSRWADLKRQISEYRSGLDSWKADQEKRRIVRKG